MTHEEVRELIPGYALDALAPDETRAAEAHLAVCTGCRRELAALREATTLLASGLPAAAPPPALRGQVLAAVRPRRGRRSWRQPWALALAAAAVLLVLVGGLSLSLERRLALVNQQMAAQEQLLALLTDPSAKEVVLAGSTPGSVRFVFDPLRRRGVLVAAGLRNPGPKAVYQVWLIAGQRADSAGVFRPGRGQTTTVTVDGDFRRYHAVAISVEPGPLGSPQPTTKPILVAAIAGAS